MADWQFWALMSAIFWVSLRVEAVNDRLGDVHGGAEGRAREDPEG